MNQNEKRQRTLIIVGIVFFLLLAIIAIYFTFFRKPSADQTGESPTFGQTSEDRGGSALDREDDRKNNTGVFAPTARLRLISEEPIAGSTSIEVEGKEMVRMLERKTAHVFDVDLDTLDKRRVSNTTVPRIYEALWTGGGEGVILRYLADDNQTIKTYFANLTEKDRELREGETPFDLSGSFLQDNITQLVLSPNKDRIFWLTETLRDSTGIISDPDGSNSRVVFNSDFTEWLPQWFRENTINMTTKASGLALGFSYNMPISTGDLNRNIGNISGLTTLTSPDGKYTLYSQSERNGFRTFIYDLETGESRGVPIRILPEKCAWSRDSLGIFCGVPDQIGSGVYPDTWYQGRTIFTDSIFRLDPQSGLIQKIYSPGAEDSESIDIYKPFISENSRYLIFNNKADMSLWAYTINDTLTSDQILESEPDI